jgi:hypothetical protein
VSWRFNLDLFLVFEVQRAIRYDALARLQARGERYTGGFYERDANVAAFHPVSVNDEHAGAIVIAFHHRADWHIREGSFAR